MLYEIPKGAHVIVCMRHSGKPRFAEGVLQSAYRTRDMTDIDLLLGADGTGDHMVIPAGNVAYVREVTARFAP